MICNYSDKEMKDWTKEVDTLFAYWNSKSRIKDRHYDQYKGHNEFASATNFKNFLEQRLEVPLSTDFILPKDLLRRAYTEIDSLERAMNGKFSNLAWIVPESTSQADPAARKFYLSLNRILEAERVSTNMLATANAEISNALFESYVSKENLYLAQSKRALGLTKDAVTMVRKLRDELAFGDPNDGGVSRFASEMEKFYQSDNGKQLKDLQTLIKLNDKEFLAASKKGFKDENGQEIIFNGHTYKAARIARKMLNDSGLVYLRGLNELKNVISLRYTNQSDPSKAKSINEDAAKLIGKVEDAILNIEASMKNIKDGKGEGYFPQMELPTVLRLKESLSKSMSAKLKDRDKAWTDLTDAIYESVDIQSLPDHVKGRNVNLEKAYETDPLLVIAEYGNQAAGFNKMVYTQRAYLDAMRLIPKSDLPFIKGLKRFIDEEYTVFTEGNATRPDWVNSIVGTISSYQTLMTMGLNVSGGIKNALSAINYYAKVGVDAISKTNHALNHDTGEGSFKMRMDQAEKEAGFLFPDIAKELYSEGLIDKETFKKRQISFDHMTGEIKIDGRKVYDHIMKYAGDATSWTVDKSLWLHRKTENWQRKWMFRTAFHHKYSQLLDQGYAEGKAYGFSKNFALEQVNGWAYEYAKHAKSKVGRGEWRVIEEINNDTIVGQLKGAGSGALELSFQLMHYPQSLFSSQAKILKGAGKSILSRQLPKQLGGSSEELSYIMRYSGMMLTIGLASAATNINMFNMFDVDTANRIKNTVESVYYPLEERQRLYGDDNTLGAFPAFSYDRNNKATFGVTGSWLGVTPNKMFSSPSGRKLAEQIFDWSIAGSIDNTDGDLIADIMFGNVDFSDKEDRLAKQYAAYQYSTFYGTMKNKIWPALTAGRGRDLPTHYLKMYPSPWTKRAHKHLYGKTKKPQYGYGNMDENTANALKLIRSGIFNKET